MKYAITQRPTPSTHSLRHSSQARVSGSRRGMGPRIGDANDPLEQEAHRAAEVVTTSSRSAGAVAPPPLSAVRIRPSPDPMLAPQELQAQQAPPSVTAVLARSGEALTPSLRREMEQRFGCDFSQVRVHADAQAAVAAREVQARAWTVGRHIAFGAGRYAPESPTGRRLVAHELAHVVQQAKAASSAPSGVVANSFGSAKGQPNAEVDRENKTLYVPGTNAGPVLQRELVDSPAAPEPSVEAVSAPPETDAVAEAPEAPGSVDRSGAAEPAQSPPVTAGPAVPTLSATPAATLTRGDTLTATMAFTARAGETMNVVAWRYTTPNHGIVTRATTEADFQTRWSGQMALGGSLAVDYTVTPAGGAASTISTLTQAVTVNDRAGAPWAAAADLRAENALTGKPNPPKVFSDLGVHNLTIRNPVATATALAAGPNVGFSFVSSLTAGTYVSQPGIHPALTTAASRFNTFHQNPSRLYLVIGTARTLIPLTDYSALSIAGGTMTFTVPNWEAFYKARRFYAVTASGNSGAGPVALRDAWWGLVSNSATANLSVLDATAIRGALRIPGTEGFSLSATARGSWQGFELMQSAAILAGTRSHEYMHGTHSHRANFTAMLRAVDPQRKVEQTVSSPSNSVVFTDKIDAWVAEIRRPDHELVDEAASRTAEAFVAAAGGMAGVNTDPASGSFLGSVWNITDDAQMTN